MLLNALVILITFIVMEGITWFTHKYIMHGFGWFLHEDHHQPPPHFFEKNDLFFLIFAIPSAYLYVSGIINHDFRLYIGIGISVYGAAYLFVHDIIIHQRFKLLRNSTHWYVKAIRRAHKMHHKHLYKHDGECFGMLYVPMKYFRMALNKEI